MHLSYLLLSPSAITFFPCLLAITDYLLVIPSYAKASEFSPSSISSPSVWQKASFKHGILSRGVKFHLAFRHLQCDSRPLDFHAKKSSLLVPRPLFFKIFNDSVQQEEHWHKLSVHSAHASAVHHACLLSNNPSLKNICYGCFVSFTHNTALYQLFPGENTSFK